MPFVMQKLFAVQEEKNAYEIWTQCFSSFLNHIIQFVLSCVFENQKLINISFFVPKIKCVMDVISS